MEVIKHKDPVTGRVAYRARCSWHGCNYMTPRYVLVGDARSRLFNHYTVHMSTLRPATGLTAPL
jgi:hypothetical protein